MFLDLFYGLRDEGVPVALQEWMTFLEALRQGLHGSSLLRFYHLARACLVKSETYYDSFDRVFARVFQGVEGQFDVTDEMLEWLRNAKDFPNLTPEQLAQLERLSADELMQRFLETLAQQTERHDGGEIELVFRPPRRNDVRLLLLMDVGGTMDPYFEPMSQLLTALHEERGLRDFEPYYFHNCIYDHVYRRAHLTRADAVPTGDLLRRFDERWKLAIVGDGAMHPSELLEPHGGINPHNTSPTPGVAWLHRLAGHFDRAVWINPDDQPLWDQTYTARTIRRLFPMFHLSVDGLGAAVQALVGARV